MKRWSGLSKGRSSTDGPCLCLSTGVWRRLASTLSLWLTSCMQATSQTCSLQANHLFCLAKLGKNRSWCKCLLSSGHRQGLKGSNICSTTCGLREQVISKTCFWRSIKTIKRSSRRLRTRSLSKWWEKRSMLIRIWLLRGSIQSQQKLMNWQTRYLKDHLWQRQRKWSMRSTSLRAQMEWHQPW